MIRSADFAAGGGQGSGVLSSRAAWVCVSRETVRSFRPLLASWRFKAYHRAVDRNLKFLIAYDGSDFHGWQNQPGLPTVQGTLEQAARRVLRHQVEVIGSGRTDAGVHAAGQTAHVITERTIPAYNIMRAIGSRIPKTISLRDVSDVSLALHATRSALSKLYRYRIHARAARPAEQHTQRYTYHFWNPLDEARIREAARHFVGTHDFSAMASAGCERESMVRTVLRCDIFRHYEEIRIDVEGTGFLYNQVRNMVGTLIEVGRGHWPPERVAEIIAGRDRRQAGPTAPARGLCLQWVRYPAHLLRPALSGGGDGERESQGDRREVQHAQPKTDTSSMGREDGAADQSRAVLSPGRAGDGPAGNDE